MEVVGERLYYPKPKLAWVISINRIWKLIVKGYKIFMWGINETIKKIYDLIVRGRNSSWSFYGAIMVIVFAAGFGRTIGIPSMGMEMSTFFLPGWSF